MLNLFGSKKDIITLEVKLAKNDHIDCCKGLEGQKNEKNKNLKYYEIDFLNLIVLNIMSNFLSYLS